MGFFDALRRFFGTEKGHRAEAEETEEKAEEEHAEASDSSDHVGHDVDIWKK